MSFSTRVALATALVTIVAASHAAPLKSQGTWWGTDGTDGTLKARDINGDAVALDSTSAAYFYDTSLRVTWRANMNEVGPKNWGDAVAWAGGLTDFGGGWRLPNIIDSGAAGCQLSRSGGTDCGSNVQTQVGSDYSEWAHLYYVTLGNLAQFDTNGVERTGNPGVDWGLTNTAYFLNMQSFGYWSGTSYASVSDNAWGFSTLLGFQGFDPTNAQLYAVAVRRGDVLRDGAAVPEPHSLALALTALAGLGLALRRRRKA